jgi:hypothetical protein
MKRMTDTNHEDHTETFRRAITVGRWAAANVDETGTSRKVYLSGLVAGLVVALGETMSDGELMQSLDQCVDFARAWREHDATKAN